MELLLHKHQRRQTYKSNTDLLVLTYHNIFDYPLTKEELVKWRVKNKIGRTRRETEEIGHSGGYYFLKGREELLMQRKLREKSSKEKMKIAKKAALVLGKLPSIKMVGVTGSLAMMNAKDESDIDLMVITARDSLWTTRIISNVLLRACKLQTRKAGDKNEKDKLCLNIWMDEADLKITQKSIYTAHEIAQIKPILNKERTYERLLWENKWILDYWPKAVLIKNLKFKIYNSRFRVLGLLEKFAFWLQYQFMKRKITREVVTPTRAFFHPFDWGELVRRRGF